MKLKSGIIFALVCAATLGACGDKDANAQKDDGPAEPVKPATVELSDGQPTEKPDAATDSKTTSETEGDKDVEVEKTVAADVIKSFDFMNGLAPADRNFEGCDIWMWNDYPQLGTEPNLNVMPDEAQSQCWFHLTDGIAAEMVMDMTGRPGALGMDIAQMAPQPQDLDTSDPASSTVNLMHSNTFYGDFDGDGYLDMTVPFYGAGYYGNILYIVNPEDPEHPSAGVVAGAQGGAYLHYLGDGRFEQGMDAFADQPQCAHNRWRVTRDANGYAQISEYEEATGVGVCLP